MPLLWHSLPAEIKTLIIQKLSQGDSKIASLATVSREWQLQIEQHTFARIRLTSTRLLKFGAMTSRNRNLVRYLWVCLELERYDCTTCAYGPVHGSDVDGVVDIDDEEKLYATKPAENARIRTALQRLFSVLSSWEPNGTLSLDISVYSPSDSEHWFKHLTVEPDTPWRPRRYDSQVEQVAEARACSDEFHNWMTNFHSITIEPDFAVRKVFGQIMTFGAFEDQDQEDEWWLGLPLIPAVTRVLIRSQNRRRWKPRALASMISRFPRLRVLHYEPWVEWSNFEQARRDKAFHHLLKYLASTGLGSLTIFENFHEPYSRCMVYDPQRIRFPNPSLGRMLARASLNLTSLSASYIVDAVDFFLCYAQTVTGVVAALDHRSSYFAALGAKRESHKHHEHVADSRLNRYSHAKPEDDGDMERTREFRGSLQVRAARKRAAFHHHLERHMAREPGASSCKGLGSHK